MLLNDYLKYGPGLIDLPSKQNKNTFGTVYYSVMVKTPDLESDNLGAIPEASTNQPNHSSLWGR